MTNYAGNAAYAATFDGDYSPDNPPADLNSVKYVKMLRVVNIPDIVPKVNCPSAIHMHP